MRQVEVAWAPSGFPRRIRMLSSLQPAAFRTPLTDFLRRALVEADPDFTSSELALLVSGFVGDPTVSYVGRKIRSISEIVDELVKLFGLRS